MRISGYQNSFNSRQVWKKPQVDKKAEGSFSPAQNSTYSTTPIQPYNISFKANQSSRGVAQKIEEDKKKLYRQLKEVLDTNYSESAIEDLDTKAQMIAANYFSKIERRKEEIERQSQIVFDDKTLSVKMKYDTLGSLDKEYRMLCNKLKKGLVVTFNSTPEDEKTDLVLINNFKNAIQENNFDLDRVYCDYYKNLEKIKTIKKLNKKYPKIKIPSNPQDVIAKKFTDVLTRDFYYELDNLFEEKKTDEMTAFIDQKIKELLEQSLAKSQNKFEEAYLKTAIPIAHEILSQYQDAKLNDKLDSIPTHKKHKVPQITENDLALLSVDFDDYVTSVVRQHFLYSKKLNDIVYEKDGQKLLISRFKESEYKFQKQPEKIRNYIKTAAKIKETERNYDKYDVESLKSRLTYYAATPIGNNEKILEPIIEFATCKFEDEDIKQLKKLLQELDKIYDNKKTADDVAETIKKENIKPQGTERVTAEEKLKAEELLKEERKRTTLLNKIKATFDEMINTLYLNNLNYLASICSLYRPNDLERITLQRAKYINDLIKKETSNNSLTINNRANLEAMIMNWHTYNTYEQNYKDTEIFKKANEFAKTKYGSVDTNKAGQYLVNYDIAKAYPDSLNFSKSPEILKLIIEKTEKDIGKAAEYLCKYSDYTALPNQDKTKLQSILKLFNLKDSIDKAILKTIVENDYVNIDTKASIKQGQEGTITTTFAKSAKQQIIEKYKFPLCLEFLEGFESAIEVFAPYENATGIK